jgi:hypothetical protein
MRSSAFSLTGVAMAASVAVLAMLVPRDAFA